MAELKLPRGACDETDIETLRVHFNWIAFILSSRKYIDPEELEEATEVHTKAREALQSLIARTKNAKSERFVAKAEELNAIREGVAYFDLPLRDALETAPRHLERDYRAMRAYMASIGE